jgi:hypothetical protein
MAVFRRVRESVYSNVKCYSAKKVAKNARRRCSSVPHSNGMCLDFNEDIITPYSVILLVKQYASFYTVLPAVRERSCAVCGFWHIMKHREEFMIYDLIKPYLGKKASIQLNGSPCTLTAIDWGKYVKEHEAFMKKVEGMTAEQMDEFYENNISTLIMIIENFLDAPSANKVLDGEWIPFAILGMSDTLGTLSDMSNNGVLLFDMTSADAKNPVVLWFKEGKVTTLAGSFSELRIV